MIVNWLGVWLYGKVVEWMSNFPYTHPVFSAVKAHLVTQKGEENA